MTSFIALSHQCKTFGQAFQRDDGTFYSTFGVTCQWDKKWTTSVIPHPCKCKHFLITSDRLQHYTSTSVATILQGKGVLLRQKYPPSTN